MDYLGQLAPEVTRNFAAALDLGLVPLANNPFNESRFPIKFAEYMAAGTPVLCSAVGECATFFDVFPWALPAGSEKDTWLKSFRETMELAMAGSLPIVNHHVLAKALSWQHQANLLDGLYQAELTASTTRAITPTL